MSQDYFIRDQQSIFKLNIHRLLSDKKLDKRINRFIISCVFYILSNSSNDTKINNEQQTKEMCVDFLKFVIDMINIFIEKINNVLDIIANIKNYTTQTTKKGILTIFEECCEILWKKASYVNKSNKNIKCMYDYNLDLLFCYTIFLSNEKMITYHIEDIYNLYITDYFQGINYKKIYSLFLENFLKKYLAICMKLLDIVENL